MSDDKLQNEKLKRVYMITEKEKQVIIRNALEMTECVFDEDMVSCLQTLICIQPNWDHRNAKSLDLISLNNYYRFIAIIKSQYDTARAVQHSILMDKDGILELQFFNTLGIRMSLIFYVSEGNDRNIKVIISNKKGEQVMDSSVSPIEVIEHMVNCNLISGKHNTLGRGVEETYIKYIYNRLMEMGREVLNEKNGVHIELPGQEKEGDTFIKTYRRVPNDGLVALLNALDDDAFKTIIYDGSSRLSRRIADFWDEHKKLLEDEKFSKIKMDLVGHSKDLNLVLVTTGDAVWIKNGQDEERHNAFMGKLIQDILPSHMGVVFEKQKSLPSGDLVFSHRLISMLKKQTLKTPGPVCVVKRRDRSNQDVQWKKQCDAALHFSIRENNELVMEITKFDPDQTIVDSRQWVVPLNIEF